MMALVISPGLGYIERLEDAADRLAGLGPQEVAEVPGDCNARKLPSRSRCLGARRAARTGGPATRAEEPGRPLRPAGLLPHPDGVVLHPQSFPGSPAGG